MSNVKRVAVTGAAGQIGYSLLPLIASGAIFGPNQKVALQLLEVTPVLAIPGISMVATFDWSRVRLTLGATCGTYSSVVERSIAVHQQPSLLLLEG